MGDTVESHAREHIYCWGSQQYVIVGATNIKEAPMPTPFGPRLIGETEKTLNAVLRAHLDGIDLTEPEWVSLRITGLLAGEASDVTALADVISQRAHFADAADLVQRLEQRGLVASGELTDEGRTLLASMQERISSVTTPVWEDLPAEDVAAAERVLNLVRDRAQALLSS